jgi:hypothetical protein
VVLSFAKKDLVGKGQVYGPLTSSQKKSKNWFSLITTVLQKNPRAGQIKESYLKHQFSAGSFIETR